MPSAGPSKSRHKGHYYAPHPLDFGIIERLPNEGSTLGYHTIAIPVKPLTDELNQGVDREAHVKASQVTGRLVSMKKAGLTVQAVMIGQNERWGWQRTEKGVRMYEKVTGKKLPTGNGHKLRVIENEDYHDNYNDRGGKTTEAGGN